MLLSGRLFDEFTPELKQKVKMSGLDQWLEAIPRNLKVLFELSDDDGSFISIILT